MRTMLQLLCAPCLCRTRAQGGAVCCAQGLAARRGNLRLCTHAMGKPKKQASKKAAVAFPQGAALHIRLHADQAVIQALVEDGGCL